MTKRSRAHHDISGHSAPRQNGASFVLGPGLMLRQLFGWLCCVVYHRKVFVWAKLFPNNTDIVCCTKSVVTDYGCRGCCVEKPLLDVYRKIPSRESNPIPKPQMPAERIILDNDFAPPSIISSVCPTAACQHITYLSLGSRCIRRDETRKFALRVQHEIRPGYKRTPNQPWFTLKTSTKPSPRYTSSGRCLTAMTHWLRWW